MCITSAFRNPFETLDIIESDKSVFGKLCWLMNDGKIPEAVKFLRNTFGIGMLESKSLVSAFLERVGEQTIKDAAELTEKNNPEYLL